MTFLGLAAKPVVKIAVLFSLLVSFVGFGLSDRPFNPGNAAELIARLKARGCVSQEGIDNLLKETDLHDYVNRYKADRDGNGDLSKKEQCEMFEDMEDDVKKNGKGPKFKGKNKKLWRKLKKGLGPFAVLVSVFFITEDVKAHGFCCGVARNTPIIEYYFEGKDQIDAEFERLEKEMTDEVNRHVLECHRDATRIAIGNAEWEIAQCKPPNVLPQEALLGCVESLYNAVHSKCLISQPINPAVFDFQACARALCTEPEPEPAAPTNTGCCKSCSDEDDPTLPFETDLPFMK